ncbi:MAG TPA: hypothetical protein VMW63_06540 [Methanoregulaceae archaeon]|nr:hypothetical protein [Methanoregulaceae archaeon]
MVVQAASLSLRAAVNPILLAGHPLWRTYKQVKQLGEREATSLRREGLW